MDNTKGNGPDSQNAELGTEGAGQAPLGEAQPGEAGKVDAPFHGFDDAGEYFVIRVHKSFGYIFILGWLIKAGDWLKMHVAMQAQEQKAKQLIKPKGFRGFNPFKR